MLPLFKKAFKLKTTLHLSEIKALRVKVFFDSTQTLEKSLEQISTILQQKNTCTILVQVIYQTEQIERSAANLHFKFMQNHPNLSTYLPLCLPIFEENFNVWATPHNCQSCIFFEGKRCDGLGNPLNFIQILSNQDNNSEIYLSLKNQPTMILSKVDAGDQNDVQSLFSIEQFRDEQVFELEDLFQSSKDDNLNRHDSKSMHVSSVQGALMDLGDLFLMMDQDLDLNSYAGYFKQNPPLAYWRLEGLHVEAMVDALLKNQVSLIWDIGGGNGFLSEYLSRWIKHHTSAEMLFQVIDPVDIYSTSSLTERIPMTVEAYIERFKQEEWANIKVDALIISWPPAGNGFDEIIEFLNPKVVIYAYDGEGFCGRQQGSFYAEWIGGKPYFFEHSRIDFLVQPQRPNVRSFEVSTYREHQAQQKVNFRQKGILSIHSREE